MAKRTVAQWKKIEQKKLAKKLKVKLETIRIVPFDTKRGIKVLWQFVDSTYCSINHKIYRIYWVQTEEQFMKGEQIRL